MQCKKYVSMRTLYNIVFAVLCGALVVSCVQDFGFDYVKALATGFFEINNVSFFSAEGLDIYGADVAGIMEKAKENITK